MKEQVEHLGPEERLLFEQKHGARENEDIPTVFDAFNEKFTFEDVLSIQEQIQHLKDYKSLTLEDKFFQFMTGDLDPHIKPIFDDSKLSQANTLNFKEEREMEMPNPNQPPTFARILAKDRPFKEEAMNAIQEKIAELQ